MTTLNLQVGAGADDGRRNSGSSGFSAVADTVAIGFHTAASLQVLKAFYRFTSVSGLSGSTINTATFSIYGFTTAMEGSPLTKISADDQETPAAPTDATEFDAITLTTAGVDWDPSSLTDDAFNAAPDISAVVQELADSYDPSVIQIRHDDDGSATDSINRIRPRQYDFDTAKASKLDIDFTAGAGGQTLSPSGIASAEAFGAAQLNLGFTASGIVSAEAFGSASVAALITGAGIASAEAFGAAQLNLAFTASGIASLEAFGSATITFDVIFSDFGTWRALINPDDYPANAQFFFEAILATSDAGEAVFARLFNITDAVVVADSEITSTDTSGERVQSSALSLPSADKEYRAERGGQAGATYRCYAAHVKVQSG